MTIKQLYPTQRPALDLNFARQKRLDSRVTFTRGSTATYVGSDGLIKTAASGEARFDHDPETGESLGLLVEESRTNLMSYSEEFDNANWYTPNDSISANSVAAPDGQITADKLVEGTGTGIHPCSQQINVSSVTHTYSIFAKAAERTALSFYTADGGERGVRVNLLNGTPINYIGGVTLNDVIIVSFPNGWYRISFKWTNVGTVARIGIRPLDNANADSYTGDGSSGLYFWGAQIEGGSFPTSYIPTEGSTVTRAAEVTTMTGTNFSSWYNQTEGSFILDERNSYSSGNSVRFEVVQDSSPNTNAVGVAVNYGNGTRLVSRDSGSAGSMDRTLFNVWTEGGSHKYAYGLAENNLSVVSGTNVATNTSCTFPPNLDSLSIGGQGRAVSSYNPVGRVNIARLTYYPYRLTDSQLQELTR